MLKSMIRRPRRSRAAAACLGVMITAPVALAPFAALTPAAAQQAAPLAPAALQKRKNDLRNISYVLAGAAVVKFLERKKEVALVLFLGALGAYREFELARRLQLRGSAPEAEFLGGVGSTGGYSGEGEPEQVGPDVFSGPAVAPEMAPIGQMLLLAQVLGGFKPALPPAGSQAQHRQNQKSIERAFETWQALSSPPSSHKDPRGYAGEGNTP